ncbi:MAG: MotA/TolQ/ExbB proton channel family protein [Phycisphaerae bacterium]|nr:MotA/TolQ/ExbB proton channel family protein [Phycisphaerae bacterium]
MRRLILVCGLLVVGVLIVAAQAFGQEGAGEQPTSVSKVFDHFVVAGGPITWFVLIPLSVATIALAIEHCLSIRRSMVIPEQCVEQLGELMEQKQYAKALEFTAEDDSMLSHVIHSGLSEASNGFDAMEQAMDDTIEERAARLMRKIEYLNVIWNVSPMIGLFGTVFGMIKLFASIGSFGGNLDAGQIADDLSIALVTTFWGLLVAIPALVIFSLFRNRIDVLTAECAVIAEGLVSVFKPGTPPSPGKPNTAPNAT